MTAILRKNEIGNSLEFAPSREYEEDGGLGD
jgi:hypothetical protein